MDIRKTFIALTQYTQVLGEEHELRKFLPSNVKMDQIGNYYLKIGERHTMFAAHLDTAAHKKEKVNHVFDSIKKKNGSEEYFIETDGSTLLGADDRSGVLILLYMIENKVPGLYYFFIGEERGTVGSSGIVKKNPDFFKEYKKCISFDRKGYGSIISRQLGGKCCSIEFVNALAKELTSKTGYKHQEDKTGIYTDSAVFMDIIPECTNLSVGYFNEHSTSEFQNMTYLENICKGFIKVNWEELPVERDATPLATETPDPVRKPKKPGDLSDDELEELFEYIENLLEDFDLFCANIGHFIPEKEMVFFDVDDEDTRISLYVHEDGSITFNNEDFDDVNELERFLEYDNYKEEEENYSDLSDEGKLVNYVEDNNLSKVEELLMKGVDPDAYDGDAIGIASMSGHYDMVKLLIKYGANVKLNDNYALKWSSRKGYYNIVKILVENGADVNAGDGYPLSYASIDGHKNIVEYLLKNGANVHTNNDQALRWTSAHNKPEVIKLLLKYGANVHAEDDYALKRAQEKGHDEVVKILKDHMNK